MTQPQKLLQRLDKIAASLHQRDGALALLGLGSVGIERARLDDYSDLDFFVIVAPGYKRAFIEDLGWLSQVHPLAYSFPNTDDGSKALYADGIFCEFAVFDVDELARIPFAEGQWVWHVEGFDTSLRVSRLPQPSHTPRAVAWLLGEALTNLYVGLLRFHRGEKLTAQRFIQHYAVDRVLELVPHILEEQAAFRDPFAPERRFEQRYPSMNAHLPLFIQGYERSPESAQAILSFLDSHFEINPAIAAAITGLIERK